MLAVDLLSTVQSDLMDSPKSADEEFDDSISDRSYWIRQGGDWIWARDSSENRTQLEKDVTTHPIWSPTRLADLINHILYPRAQPSNHSEVSSLGEKAMVFPH